VNSGGPPQKPSHGRIGAIAPRTLGRFVIDERLSSGGTADVFLAHPMGSEATANKVVVKRLLASLRNDPDSRAAFLEEAALHRRFEHPNIVRCLEVGDHEGEPYLVMELVLGADLHRVMRLAQARKRPIAPPLACYLAREILAGLAVVHDARGEDGSPLGIVHRDVSPSNVYLSTTGDVKLGDFGIARQATTRTPRAGTLGNSIKGKFAYLAPEQVASESVDHRADLFAVANIMAEMMLARPLFAGSGQLAVLLSIRDARVEALDRPSAIPLPLVQILKRALARDPNARFQDAETFARALAPFAWHDAANARREIAQLVRWARETSMELRAVGAHPDQGPAPTAPPGEPLGAQIARPQPSLRLDSSILREDPSGPHPAQIQIIAPPPSSVPRPASPHDNVTAPYSPEPSRVRTTDGQLLGPLSYAKLVELVVTGRLGPDDRVDFMGTGFERLEDIDELARHLAPRSTVTRQLQGPGAPDWHGFAAERYDEEVGGALDPGIALALAYAGSHRATGILLAQQGARRKEIYFAGGRVHHVASTEPGEMLGEYLVARGVLERTDLDFALAVLPRFNGRLGEALASLGLIDPVAMFNAIRDQGRDKIVEVFLWSEGDLSFYRDAAPGKVEFPLELPIGPVIEAGVAAMLDEKHAAARFRPWLDRRVRLGDAAPALIDAGWSGNVERMLTLAKESVLVRAALKTLTSEGIGSVDAMRAIESARVARVLEWSS
jgi:serine/threonine protein kinase